MSDRMSRFDRALGELKRRHVLRVLGAYAVTVWAVLQVADIVLPALMAPGWIMTVLVAATVIGAPVTAVLAWIYDLTPKGVQKTEFLSSDLPPVPPMGGRTVDYFIIAGLLLILAFVLLKPGPEDARIGTSIAVLPFSNLSADQDNRYLGDGVAEAIMDQLARIPGIQVSARTSSFSFRDQGLAAQALADRLGVETLLEGSVRRQGDDLRISARLINGRDGKQVWSSTHNGTLETAFELQDNIATAIAEVMRVQLEGPGQMERGLITRDAEAFDLYLRGRAIVREASGTNIGTAIDLFDKALLLDPSFGLAAAGVCRATWERYRFTRKPEHAEYAFRQCDRTRTRNLELAETRIALGSLLLGTGKLDEALDSFRKALELEPNNAEAHAGLARTLMDEGRYEAAAKRAQRAIDADPAYWQYPVLLAQIHYYKGELDAAKDAVAQAMRLAPENPTPWNLQGAIFFARGEFRQAGNAFEQSISRAPSALAYSNAGTNYFFAGEFARAEAMYHRAVELAPGQERFIGFLAWSIRAQPDRTKEAEPFHRDVIRTATERLAINVNDQAARSMLAMHLAALEHDIAAHAALDNLPDPASLDMNSVLTAGLAHHLLGNARRAVDAFDHALEKGLPFYLLRADPRLTQAWEHAHFAALAARHQPENSFTHGDKTHDPR